MQYPERNFCLPESVLRKVGESLFPSATGHGLCCRVDADGWIVKVASILAAGVLVAAPSSVLAAEKGSIIVGEPRVVDGDTLVVCNPDGLAFTWLTPTYNVFCLELGIGRRDMCKSGLSPLGMPRNCSTDNEPGVACCLERGTVSHLPTCI